MPDDRALLDLLEDALRVLREGDAHLPDFAARDVDLGALRETLTETARRMRDNFPYRHPLYAGQMLKPPHEVARLAYALAQVVNPNNHARDGGRASSAMETEAVADLARMLGFDQGLGHLTSGGTFANLEALWVAGLRRPEKRIIASTQAHYTHERICAVLRLPFGKVACDRHGRMDLGALEAELERGDVGTVVATLGTTLCGAVDPLHDLEPLARRHGARVHVDAAYGGYFTLSSRLGASARAAYDALRSADSIVIDPHKHGLQPYGCGCVLFRDPSVASFYRHDSPYTYFSSQELHLGEISLECSRPGAAAVALWATQRHFPLVEGGVFAARLDASLAAGQAFERALAANPRVATLLEPELDIVVWAIRAPTASAASASARRLFQEAAKDDLHLALANVPRVLAERALGASLAWDADHVTCLRACLLKPEHEDFIHELVRRHDAALTRVL